jgi:hypothetical protein
MRKLIVASLLSVPALALSQGQADAFICFQGKFCGTYNFAMPRIVFGFDTGCCKTGCHHGGHGGWSGGYGFGSPWVPAPPPWYMQWPPEYGYLPPGAFGAPQTTYGTSDFSAGGYHTAQPYAAPAYQPVSYDAYPLTRSYQGAPGYWQGR